MNRFTKNYSALHVLLLILAIFSFCHTDAMAVSTTDGSSSKNDGNNSSNGGSGNSGGSGGSGVGIGNGGQSVICRNESKEIVRAEAFDLFEGRALFGFEPKIPEGLSAVEVAKYYAKKVDLSLGLGSQTQKSVEAKVNFIEKNIRFLPAGVGLKPTGDAKEFVLPKDCELVQTVNFRDSLQIFVDSDVWKILPETSKAALYLHEAIYWQFREMGLEQDSRRTRKAVAYLFSGGKLQSRSQFFASPELPIQFCKTATPNASGDYNTNFFAYRHHNIEILQFLQVGGYGLLGRTVITRELSAQSSGLVINQNSAKTDQIGSWLNSQPDVETYLQVSWGLGKTNLLFRFQSDAPQQEAIECEELTYSEDQDFWDNRAWNLIR